MASPSKPPLRGARLPQLTARRLTLGGLRLYEIEGALYPSVTSVLSVIARPNLVAWARRTVLESLRQALDGRESIERGELLSLLERAEREPERLRDEAAQRGQGVHGAIALALQGEPYPPDREPYVAQALACLASRGLQVVGSEAVLVSRRHGFAGTCDVASLGEGGLVLLDWKTGGLYPEHALQLGAYAIALQEMTGEEVREALLVALREDGYQARPVELPLAREGFLGALALFRALRGELLGPRRGGFEGLGGEGG